jgi:hypothetical protein
MPSNPPALSPANQPAVNTLCNDAISPATNTGRNWQTQRLELAQRIGTLFVLTGETKLSNYLD